MIRTLLLLAALVVCSLAVETEHMAILKVTNPEHIMALIKRGISLDHPNKKHQTFEAYLTEKDFAVLNEYNVEYEIQQPAVEHMEKRGGTVDYHNYQALTGMHTTLHTLYIIFPLPYTTNIRTCVPMLLFLSYIHLLLTHTPLIIPCKCFTL